MHHPSEARGARHCSSAATLLVVGSLGACAGTPDAVRQPDRVAAAAAAEVAGGARRTLCDTNVQHPAAGSAVRCRTPEEVIAERESAKAALSEYLRIGRVRGAKW